jgi:glucose/arabinose dehydrogenase
MQKMIWVGTFATVAVLLWVDTTTAAISGIQRVGSGLNVPAFATAAPGDTNRLFVAQLDGKIQIINNLNTATPAVSGTFLTIPDVDFDGEGGLLGLAFHPDYFSTDTNNPGRGKFYVYVTADDDPNEGVFPFDTQIREYVVSGDPATSNVANPTPTRTLMRFTQPQSNHNGGWIGFNPKLTPTTSQYLYIASGDGGGGGDTGTGHTATIGNAQDTTNNLLGKMLRIDVNGDDFPTDATRNYKIPSTNPFVGVTGDDEIWAYGLRNPYRDSFDRQTGDLWIGDVGQGAREEIDFQAASKTTVSNYGWRLWEGNLNYGAQPTDPFPPDYVGPIYDYTRGSGALQGETVIGGYRYRGPDPDLQGRYIFGDANDLNVWQMIPPNPVVPNTAVTNIDATLGNLAGINRIVSFGEDANGNLYIVDLGGTNTGEVYRILTNKLLAGDYNADGDVNNLDYDLWRTTFGTATGSRPADGSGNGVVDAADYVIWRKNFGASVHAGAGSGAGSAANVPELSTAAYFFEVAVAMLLLSWCQRRPRLATIVA